MLGKSIKLANAPKKMLIYLAILAEPCVSLILLLANQHSWRCKLQCNFIPGTTLCILNIGGFQSKITNHLTTQHTLKKLTTPEFLNGSSKMKLISNFPLEQNKNPRVLIVYSPVDGRKFEFLLFFSHSDKTVSRTPSVAK